MLDWPRENDYSCEIIANKGNIWLIKSNEHNTIMLTFK